MKNNKGFGVIGIILIIVGILVVGGGAYSLKHYKHNDFGPIDIESEMKEVFDLDTNEENITNDESDIQENKTNNITTSTENQDKVVKIITEDPNRKKLFEDFDKDNLNISISDLDKFETDIFSFYAPKNTMVQKMKPDINNPLSGCDFSVIKNDKETGGVIILLKSCLSRFAQDLGNIDAGFEKDGYAIIASYNAPLEEINISNLSKLKELYQSIKKTFSLNSNVKAINVFWGFNWSTIEGCPSSVMNAISRYVTKDTNEARSSVEELIKGPTSTESFAHFWSGFSDNFTLESFDLKNGIAIVELSTPLNVESDAWEDGSCGEKVAWEQLYYTLGQFPYIEKIIYKINGKQQTKYSDIIFSNYR